MTNIIPTHKPVKKSKHNLMFLYQTFYECYLCCCHYEMRSTPATPNINEKIAKNDTPFWSKCPYYEFKWKIYYRYITKTIPKLCFCSVIFLIKKINNQDYPIIHSWRYVRSFSKELGFEEVLMINPTIYFFIPSHWFRGNT